MSIKKFFDDMRKENLRAKRVFDSHANYRELENVKCCSSCRGNYQDSNINRVLLKKRAWNHVCEFYEEFIE
jgi:hypothetical protein